LKTIFIVDDNNVNLLAADEVLSEFYHVFTMPSAASMFELLENIQPDLILLDILMPEMNGFEALQKLKSSRTHADIPVIFLTSQRDELTESKGFEMGVVDFISKPFSRLVLLNRIKTHLEIENKINERTDNLNRLKNAIVSVLANMMENRDKMTSGHLERTSKYIRLMLETMLQNKKAYYNEIRQWDMELVISSARLHDIGKIVITDIILNKPKGLDKDEVDIIKTHVIEGMKVIDTIIEEAGDEPFLQYAKKFAGYHHERWDGKGYPHGLKGEDIPLQGRIMAVVDAYDALVSDRPYKNALSHAEAVEIIKKDSGTHFDPKLVEVFLECEKTIDIYKIK